MKITQKERALLNLIPFTRTILSARVVNTILRLTGVNFVQSIKAGWFSFLTIKRSHKMIKIVADDKVLMGTILPKWYGVAYRKYALRQTVLYIIPLNLIVRYAWGLRWMLYRWLKHEYYGKELAKAYHRGRADGYKEADLLSDRSFNKWANILKYGDAEGLDK